MKTNNNAVDCIGGDVTIFEIGDFIRDGNTTSRITTINEMGVFTNNGKIYSPSDINIDNLSLHSEVL